MRRSTGRQPGTKSASRPAVNPLVNHWSTPDFVSTFGLNRISPVRASGETFLQYFLDALGGARDARLLGELFCRRPVLTDPIPSPRRALRPDPTRPWYVRVLDSAGARHALYDYHYKRHWAASNNDNPQAPKLPLTYQ